MGKRVFILLIIFLWVNAFPKVTAASSSTVEGVWLIDGKLKGTGNFLEIVSATFSISDLGALVEVFNFYPDGSFSDELIGLNGTWEQNDSNFSVKMDLDELITELEEYGLQAEVTQYAFSGKLQNSDKMKGKITLNLSISIPYEPLSLAGSVSISGSFTGSKTSSFSIAQGKLFLMKPKSLAGFIVERLVSPFPR